MTVFVMEYRVIGYSLAHAFSTNPKAGKRTFSVKSEQIGTEDISEIAKAAQDAENTPEGYRLFSIRNIDTGHEVKP